MSQTRWLRLDIHSYWHIGSTAAAGPDVDAEPARTACHLPYVPGRTLRGLLRDAMRLTATFGGVGFTAADIARWFGTEATDGQADAEQREAQLQAARWSTAAGSVRVGSAELGRTDAERDAWRTLGRRRAGEVDRLFHRIAHTAVSEATGVALDGSLRSQRVAVPMTLWGSVSAPVGEEAQWWAAAKSALPQLIELGSHRTRGFGRVTCSLHDVQDHRHSEHASMPAGCTSAVVELKLIEPLVISRTSASTGSHESMDYVPGAMLLGAVAKSAYRAGLEQSWRLFHTGEVQFGDCAPVDADGRVAARAALSLHTPKGEKVAPTDFAFQARNPNEQWTQNRVAFSTAIGETFSPAKTYALRTSMQDGLPRDGLLYGYESVSEGQRFAGRLTTATPEHMATLWGALQGKVIHLGRAKASEFGAVQVQLRNLTTEKQAVVAKGSTSVAVRLESDLCLLDDAAQPRLQLCASDLGLPSGWKIDWSRTFVRTRRWRPFHGERKRPAMERQVLVAGSVVTFHGCALEAAQANAVQARLNEGLGLFRAEGLGRIALHAPNCPTVAVELDAAPIDHQLPADLLANDPVFKLASARQAALVDTDDEAVVVVGAARELAAYKLAKSQWGALRQYAVQQGGNATDAFWAGFLEGNLRKVAWARRRGDETLRQCLTKHCTRDGKPRSTQFVARLAAAVVKPTATKKQGAQ